MAVLKGQVLFGTLLLCLGSSYETRIQCTPSPPGSHTVYGFSAVNINETETIPFSRYTGQVLAIMNVATF